jgi:hypothetical protein
MVLLCCGVKQAERGVEESLSIVEFVELVEMKLVAFAAFS